MTALGDVTISINAEDNASDTIANVSTQLGGLSTAAGGFSAITRAGATAMIALDRYQIAANAVENAQIRQELAATRVADATKKYGVNSEQARKAQEELAIATRGVEIAQQRMEVRMIYGTVVLIPAMVSHITSLISTMREMTAANEEATVVLGGLTAAQLAFLAVSTLGIALPIAFLALSQAQSMQQAQNYNVYGDVNLQSQGVTPAAFGTAASQWQQVQQSSRP
jgi:hypothetical protein